MIPTGLKAEAPNDSTAIIKTSHIMVATISLLCWGTSMYTNMNGIYQFWKNGNRKLGARRKSEDSANRGFLLYI
jgi:hypothetical protein